MYFYLFYKSKKNYVKKIKFMFMLLPNLASKFQMLAFQSSS